MRSVLAILVVFVFVTTGLGCQEGSDVLGGVPSDDDTQGDDDDDTGFASCHPWDPIDATGAEWVYTSSYTFQVQGSPQSDSGTETVQTGGSGTFQGATVQQRLGEFAGGAYQVDWTGYDSCEADGNHDHGSYVTDGGANIDLTTINTPSVLYLPADPDQQTGYTWTVTYDQQVDANAQSDSWQVTWQFEVLGPATVTVPAGTFDAVQVRAEYDSEDYLGTHAGVLETWWVEGLGLVRWDEQRAAEGGSTILRELQSFSGPLSPQ